jgi:histidinol dehydrogenase
VLMLCIPAKAAGCEDIILCTPPSAEGKANPYIIYAASFCGVRDIYKVGGAQAIAAMAYGTESISRRDKIFGPGNRYVMKAKQIVGQRQVAIDMPAGPSEVMVLADETAIPSFVAADFLSQDEHGPDSQSVLVCTSEEIAEAVEAEINRQMAELSRQNIIVKSLGNSRIIVLHDRDAIAAFANGYAPEHLIISMRDPWAIAGKIHAAGSIFIGNFSPESAGDYASGTNHTLPTSGWARSYSALGVESFMRRMTIQELSKDGLDGIGKAIETMAMAEGLDAHAAAVKVRLKDK